MWSVCIPGNPPSIRRACAKVVRAEKLPEVSASEDLAATMTGPLIKVVSIAMIFIKFMFRFCGFRFKKITLVTFSEGYVDVVFLGLDSMCLK